MVLQQILKISSIAKIIKPTVYVLQDASDCAVVASGFVVAAQSEYFSEDLLCVVAKDVQKFLRT